MHWFSILGIGIAANLDNLGIGVSFGARSIRVTLISNLIIAVLSMIASYISITLGSFVSSYIPGNLANWCGGIMIILLGLWAIRTELRNASIVREEHSANPISNLLEHPQEADKDRNNILTWKESFALGTALALNCLAGGFGAGVTGLSPLATTISIGIFSLLTMAIGVRAGLKLSQTWLGKWSNLIGGIILIGIGLYEALV
ncbi:sporulation membrane protein YtaF [Paenibacillus cremeus]|uniref:Sporulation membrane protein YtaF n=1 Tax=Paenibacillus cremeus TaxID=2163881 RepID=A0A559K5N8_9BACL|nr:sporulation membrane protein YtaF [Paenibacillus cremeus]TVY07465.1 sporulation membrane protein YtaF [Paenibacillus cremeus]